MSQWNLYQSTVRLNGTGDAYFFIGAIGAGGVLDGAGVLIPRESYPASWDQAGWVWVLISPVNTGGTILVDQYPVFFDFPQARLFDERYRGSIAILRIVPVPWLGEYDIYGLTMERVI